MDYSPKVLVPMSQITSQFQNSQMRGPWSADEDNKLLELIQLYGPTNWVRISNFLGTRTAKQCRERYHQNLKPSLNRSPITSEEGAYIEELVQRHGKKWAEIARHLNGRSDNAIKNWWNGGANRRRRASAQANLQQQQYLQTYSQDQQDLLQISQEDSPPQILQQLALHELLRIQSQPSKILQLPLLPSNTNGTYQKQHVTLPSIPSNLIHANDIEANNMRKYMDDIERRHSVTTVFTPSNISPSPNSNSRTSSVSFDIFSSSNDSLTPNSMSRRSSLIPDPYAAPPSQASAPNSTGSASNTRKRNSIYSFTFPSLKLSSGTTAPLLSNMISHNYSNSMNNSMHKEGLPPLTLPPINTSTDNSMFKAGFSFNKPQRQLSDQNLFKTNFSFDHNKQPIQPLAVLKEFSSNLASEQKPKPEILDHTEDRSGSVTPKKPQALDPVSPSKPAHTSEQLTNSDGEASNGECKKRRMTIANLLD